MIEDLILQLKGNRLVKAEFGEAAFFLFENNDNLTIFNKFKLSSRKTSDFINKIVTNISTSGDVVCIYFGSHSICFVDAYPDTEDPEILMVEFGDGRCFVHRGD